MKCWISDNSTTNNTPHPKIIRMSFVQPIRLKLHAGQVCNIYLTHILAIYTLLEFGTNNTNCGLPGNYNNNSGPTKNYNCKWKITIATVRQVLSSNKNFGPSEILKRKFVGGVKITKTTLVWLQQLWAEWTIRENNTIVLKWSEQLLYSRPETESASRSSSVIPNCFKSYGCTHPI